MCVWLTRMALTFTLTLLLAVAVFAEEDYQQWSAHTYLEQEFSFYCNDSLTPIFINPDDRLTWRRHGHDSNIVTDDHFELAAVGDVDNMKLTIKHVTDEMAGIFFCEIHDQYGTYINRVVKGLNLGGHKYDDDLDKYETNIVTGVIAGASVFVFIVGICAIDHFRYLSDEERRERHEAKEMRKRRQYELKEGITFDNHGMDVSYGAGNGSKFGVNGKANDGFGDHTEINTHM